MPKKISSCFLLWLLLTFGVSGSDSISPQSVKNDTRISGTLEKMVATRGSGTMEFDLDRLVGSHPGGQDHLTKKFHFDLGANSFFAIRVFNKVLRGPEGGSMALDFRKGTSLPEPLSSTASRIILEKTSANGQFDLLVRDEKTGFVFFNVEGHHYEYSAVQQLLAIRGGALRLSREFADKLGRPADVGARVGQISLTATMAPIEITEVVRGVARSVVMPSRKHNAGEAPQGGGVPGPDIIVGDLPSLEQFGASGTQVGLGVGTTSCNNGNVEVDWFELPDTDHCVIPQNLYRMSGGASNSERLEQIGQSWMKHAFFALQDDACGFGCNPAASGEHLGVGCSDPYDASLNAAQDFLGSRAWVNPFTGVFPSNGADHTGHNHTGTSHRIVVETSDLNTTMNSGATYFAEAQYVTPQEYVWCQSHSDQCNMFNNASYRRFNVTGTTSFFFDPVGSTVRMTPAINAWAGATNQLIEPAPGADGRAFLVWKVTKRSPTEYHYEYAIYNQNLDRGIQSFTVPLQGAVATNFSFHAPPQQPGFPNDGTTGSAGFSSSPWVMDFPGGTAVRWSCETLAANPNANAIRWGTMYNFSFDSAQPPAAGDATIGFFKTGADITASTVHPTFGPTPTPCATTVWSENFDEEPPPAWVNGCWAISQTDPDTAPNDAFCANSATVPACALVPPLMVIPSASTFLSFRNNFDAAVSGGVFFGGGVLEVSAPNINGGDFLDITDSHVGGTFVTGGYTGEIDASASNPLAGRLAWAGSSGGYINTTINLGPNLAGQTVSLRWRFGSDPAASTGGWRIDTIMVVDESVCPATPTPAPTNTPSPTPPPTPTPSASPTPGPPQAIQLSTRLQVDSGDHAGIGGFIITGTDPKMVLLRGIGPSLAAFGIPNPLGDPTLDLRDSSGGQLYFNDNWRESQEAAIMATGIAPTDDLEAAILLTLPPGSYTVVLRGTNMGAGIAIMEIYDLDRAAHSKLANLSTRGVVETGNNVMVAGFILNGFGAHDLVVTRGIGPSLTKLGVEGALADPVLDLHAPSGEILVHNDNWQDDPAQAKILIGTGLAPTDSLESAIVADLPSAAYTLVLAGVQGDTGIGLIEVYDNPAGGPTPTPATPTPGPGPTSTPGPPPIVSAPTFSMDTSDGFVIYDQAVETTAITPILDGSGHCANNSTCFIGFQGDIVFDSAIAAPSAAPMYVAGAGLTGSGWTVNANVLNTGPGTIKTLRVAAFANDGVTPLRGAGVLFIAHWQRVSSNPGDSTALAWRAFPNDFELVDTDLNIFSPSQTDGMITITGATPTPGVGRR